MKDKIIKLFIQFVKFGCVGVSNTLISLAVYYVFLWIDPSLYLIGNAVGFIVSTFNAYFWNNRFVFKKGKKEKNITVVVKTYVSYGFSLFVSTVLLYLLVDVLGVPEAIAPILNLFVTIPLNFILNKLWVYGKGEREQKNGAEPGKESEE